MDWLGSEFLIVGDDSDEDVPTYLGSSDGSSWSMVEKSGDDTSFGSVVSGQAGTLLIQSKSWSTRPACYTTDSRFSDCAFAEASLPKALKGGTATADGFIVVGGQGSVIELTPQ